MTAECVCAYPDPEVVAGGLACRRCGAWIPPEKPLSKLPPPPPPMRCPKCRSRQVKVTTRGVIVGCGQCGWIAGRKPYVRTEEKVGRNAPCPCGSGAKYKRCCLLKEKQP